ncbi:MAG: RagB/SusD family nutrient uptake outer membrane protein, partial [Tunicatimonas sp.]
QLLPEFYDPQQHNPAFQVRANRAAASTLLAKVYWQQNDFDNTLVQINKVIGPTPGQSTFPLAEDFGEVYNRNGITGTTNAEDKSEVILEYVAREPSKISTRNGQALSNAWWRDGRTSLYFGDYFQELAAFDTTNDLRYRELINSEFTQDRGETVAAEDSAWQTLKFVPDANMPIFRSAELLLMRAEIFARRGQTEDALADLNYVRNRAGVAPVTDATGLVDQIITERIREMHAEGYRSHELKRLGSLTDGEPNEVFFLPGGRSGAEDCGYPGACDPIKWNSLMLVWPITQSELDINPLAQNP